MSPEMLEQLAARFGELVSVLQCDGSQGAVWRVVVGDGALAVKVAGAREREALRRVQGLVPAVPEIVAELESAVALRWIDGRPAADEPDVHEHAGALLRRLHALAVEDDDPISIADALAARLDRWHTRARGKVDDAAVARVVAMVEPSSFADVRRVQCHRDFTASNWIVRDDGELSAIDFGHARLDLPQWDLVKLAADPWLREPRLRERFFAGYGEPEDPRLAQLVALHGLQTAVWGVEHEDERFIDLGRRVLDSLR